MRIPCLYERIYTYYAPKVTKALHPHTFAYLKRSFSWKSYRYRRFRAQKQWQNLKTYTYLCR